MTHDDTGRDDDIMDRTVSDQYREIATERVPGHLDKAVLAAASQGARASRAPLLRWRRPLAWAATIALAFALVLEFSQMSPDLVPPAAFEPAEKEADALADAPGSLPERSDPASDVEESIVTNSAAREKAIAPAIQSEAAKRDRLRELETMSSPRASSDYNDQDAAPMTSPAPADAPSEDLRETAAAGATAARQERFMSVDSMTAVRPEHVQVDPDDLPCREKRDDAETWRACILDLRAAGELEAARAEAKLFRETFPDEPLPKWVR